MKKRTTGTRMSQSPMPEARCRDCAWITGRYNMNYKGEPVLGQCRHSEHAVLLSGAACKKFKQSLR